MKKKFFSFILMLIIFISSVPDIQVSAETAADGYLTFDTDTGFITGCDHAASGEVVIPDTINGVSVIGIGRRAFDSCSGITKATLPDTLIEISDYAFKECTGLEGINIPSGVSAIGMGAFWNCVQLTEVMLPNSVTSIGASAFYGCRMLSTINIPDSVKEIGGGAFADCGRLKSIAVPEGVEAIGGMTFENCYQLTDVTLPDSLKKIGQHVFSGCWGITSINIPSGVTEIEAAAFSECQGLESITLPNGLKGIAESAFYRCEKLTDINIPASVTEIGKNAFRRCTSFTSIAIPDGVASVNDSSFLGCTALETIAIPASVTSIGEQAFYDCKNIKKVVYGGTEDQWSLINMESGNDILKNVYISFADGGSDDSDASSLMRFESLRAGDKVIVSFDGSINNTSEDDENIFLALYIDDILSQTKIYRLNSGSYKKQLYDCEFYVGDGENISVKAFRWTADKYVPLETAAVVEQSEDKTVTFSCRAVLGDYEYDYSGGIPVRASGEGEPDTVNYALTDDAEFFVNGISAGAVTNDNIFKYILQNRRGTVTLAGTEDGKYDRVLVDYYIDAVADQVVELSEKTKLFFKNHVTNANRLEWDPASDADISFIKDGKSISYNEIKEDDILSIKYDIIKDGKASDSLLYPDYARVLVSDKKVSGMVTAVDEESQSIVLDDTQYYIEPNMLIIDDFEPNTYYDIYLDAFGCIADFTEHETLKNYGVVFGMERVPGSGDPYICLIDKDGKTQQYMCASENEADKFYNYIKCGSEYGSGKFDTVDDLNDRLLAGGTVCTYTLDANNRISFDKGFYASGGSELAYRKLTNKLGSYQMDEDTRILYYDTSAAASATVMELSDFEDRALYTAYLLDKNGNGVYRFAIVFEKSSAEPEEIYESTLTKFIKTLPKDKNSVVSPLSLKLALLMLANGAEGETQKQILDAYGIEDIEAYNPREKTVLDHYMREREDGSIINVANSIWFNTDMCQNDGAGFSEKYKETLAQYYNAEAYEVTNDTYKPSIDGWVSEKTKGLINEIVPEGENSLTAHVNTVYMKALWSHQFSKSDTEKQTFYNADGSNTETDFMNQENHFYYYKDADRKIVRIGYENGTAMYIVLGDATNFETMPGDVMVDENYKLVHLSIPKFKAEYSADLADVINNMGITKVFSDNAELGGMLVNVQDGNGMAPPLHRAVIDVDEEGTTAAGVTYIPKGGAGAPVEEKVYDFTANRPFTYFIIDEKYGEILFAGRYVTAK